MKSEIMTFINKIEGFKTSIKNFHWSSTNMSEHKLFDEIASAVADIQDEVSEQAQGIYGQIEKNELKPISYEISTEQKFLDDVISASNDLYNALNDDKDCIGIRSELEAFIGEMSKDKYLMNLSLHDKKLNENKRKSIKMTSDDFNKYITECVKQVLKQIIK